MYQRFFGLERNPFAITPDPDFLYLTDKHREALAGLLYAITCRKGFLVLTGDAGTGKTTLLRTILRRVSAERIVFSFVVHPTLTAAEFLEYTMLDFGFPNIPASKAQRLVMFQQFLVRSYEEGKNPVLVIDEAQKLSPELLEEIRLLTNAETAEHKLLQIVLAGQNELNAVLARDDMRQLRQRIAIRVAIGALSEAEVVQYLKTRWMRAGAKEKLPFTADAARALAEYSRGIPRLINTICDTALTNAFANETRTINRAQIEAAASDLLLNTASGVDAENASAVASPTPQLKMPEKKQPVAEGMPSLRTIERYEAEAQKRAKAGGWLTRLGLNRA